MAFIRQGLPGRPLPKHTTHSLLGVGLSASAELLLASPPPVTVPAALETSLGLSLAFDPIQDTRELVQGIFQSVVFKLVLATAGSIAAGLVLRFGQSLVQTSLQAGRRSELGQEALLQLAICIAIDLIG